jgi:hypothetical protein
MNIKEQLLEKINNRTAVVGVKLPEFHPVLNCDLLNNCNI